ncbi:MAG: hypothetical protein IT470_04375 [Pseudomonadales bacterium]|nr:hypothetical protein [Pseudomonadales bacterium]
MSYIEQSLSKDEEAIMKKLLLSVCSIALSCSAIAKDTMPAQFQGTWSPDKNICSADMDFIYGSSGFQISADGISGYEEGCSLEQVVSKTETVLVGNFSCGGPDGNESMNITLTLSADQNTLTTAGHFEGTRFRCK